MKNVLLKIVLLFCVLNTIMISSQTYCDSTYLGSYYSIEDLVICPPYNTSMPLDVFIGYFAMDSLGRYANPNDFTDFLQSRSYDDTTKIMMRYLYQVMDYNPETFLNFTVHNKYPAVQADDFSLSFINILERISPQPILDASLLGSYLIAKVTVNDINPFNDTNAVFAKTCRTVYANVDTVIKGSVPFRYVAGINPKEQNNQHTINDFYPLEFDYCKEWYYHEYIGIPQNNFELEVGKSYIIFFEYRYICYNEVYNRNDYVIFPLRLTKSKSTCIYEIENNNLLDPNNELGFGTSVNQSQFFQLLNNKINQIKTFTP